MKTVFRSLRNIFFVGLLGQIIYIHAMEYNIERKEQNATALSSLTKSIINTYDSNEEFRNHLLKFAQLNIQQNRIKIDKIDEVIAAIEVIKNTVSNTPLMVKDYFPSLSESQVEKISDLIKELYNDFLLSRFITLYGSLENEAVLNEFIRLGYNKNIIKILLRVCSCPKFNIADRVILVLKIINHALSDFNNQQSLKLLSFGSGKGLQEFIIAEWLEKLGSIRATLYLIEDNKETFDPNYVGIRASITDLNQRLNNNMNIIQFLSAKKYLKAGNINPDIAVAIDLDERIAPKDKFTDLTYIFLKDTLEKNPFLKIIYHPHGRCRAYYALSLTDSLTENQKEKLINAVDNINTIVLDTNLKLTEKTLELCNNEIKPIATTIAPKYELQLSADSYYKFQTLIEQIAHEKTIAFAAQNHKVITFVPKKYNPNEFISPFDATMSDELQKKLKFIPLIDKQFARPSFDQ